MRLHSLVFQHNVEQLTTMAATLHISTHVEIKDRKRFHFNDFPCAIAYEQFLPANFEKADAFAAFRSYKHYVLVCADLSDSGDLARKSLSLYKKHPNVNTHSCN